MMNLSRLNLQEMNSLFIQICFFIKKYQFATIEDITTYCRLDKTDDKKEG